MYRWFQTRLADLKKNPHQIPKFLLMNNAYDFSKKKQQLIFHIFQYFRILINCTYYYRASKEWQWRNTLFTIAK